MPLNPPLDPDDEALHPERRDAARREFDREQARRVNQMWQTIYGLPEEEGSGLVRAIVAMKNEVAKLNGRLATAAISFAIGAVTVVLTVLSQ